MRRWAETYGCKGYVGSSVKGEVAIDWSDRASAAEVAG